MLVSTFLNAESTMVILFVIVAFGYLARKLGWMDDHFDSSMSKLIMNITCPAMILSSVLSNESLPGSSLIGSTLLVSAASWVPIVFIAWLAPKLYRTKQPAQGAHQFTIAFGNTGFIGFAVLGAIMGGTAVLYASLHNIIHNIVLFSVGAYFLASSGTIEVSTRMRLKQAFRALRGPTMIASLIALVLALAGITDTSGLVARTCEMLGAMTPPASMLVVGSTLAKYDVRDMLSDWHAYPTSLLRLLAPALIVFLVGGLITDDSYVVASVALDSAMPAAAVGPIMCLTYGGDLKTISRCLFVTTIFSVFTIPLVTLFLL